MLLYCLEQLPPTDLETYWLHFIEMYRRNPFSHHILHYVKQVKVALQTHNLSKCWSHGRAYDGSETVKVSEGATGLFSFSMQQTLSFDTWCFFSSQSTYIFWKFADEQLYVFGLATSDTQPSSFWVSIKAALPIRMKSLGFKKKRRSFVQTLPSTMCEMVLFTLCVVVLSRTKWKDQSLSVCLNHGQQPCLLSWHSKWIKYMGYVRLLKKTCPGLWKPSLCNKIYWVWHGSLHVCVQVSFLLT